MPNYQALWEFQVKSESISVFEEIYGPTGDWGQLFRQSPDYLGTDLIRDLNHEGRYVTIDRWNSRDALDRFKQAHAAAYAELDKKCESLTEQENFIGDFEQIASET